MIKKYKVFTTEICPKCPAVKDFMKTLELEGEEVNASEDEGLKQASELGITTVPTVVFYDEEEKEVERSGSVEEVKKALEEQGK
ncbi:glutaredoxin family protein [Thermoproteota archaeon]